LTYTILLARIALSFDGIATQGYARLSESHPSYAPGGSMLLGTALVSGIIVFSMYAIALLFISRSRQGKSILSQEDFFLKNRSLGWLPLLLTTAATNFSAFTVLGLSGAGYRMGYIFYPAMAMGTGFMALGMYLVGVPLQEEGAKRGWITPVDLIHDRFGSPLVSALFTVCLVLCTLPYLAIQPMAAGILLESAWGLPYPAGVLIVAGLIALYTSRGGLKSLTKTDAFHGLVLLTLAILAWVLVVRNAGGLRVAHETVAERLPNLLRRPGGTASSLGLSPLALAGYYVLWFLADPLFPQLGQRFLASKDRKSLERMVTLYPLVTTTLFFFTISLGVVASVLLPGLAAGDSDRIWLLALIRIIGPVFSTIFMLAPLAALISTMDSQLLTLSSIIIRELHVPFTMKRQSIWGIAAIGAIIALFPPTDILSFLNRSSFLGYAALAPVFFGAIYSSKSSPLGAFLSIVLGESMVVLAGLRIISIPEVPDIFLVAAVSYTAWRLGNFLSSRKPGSFSRSMQKQRMAATLKPRSISAVLPPLWALSFLAIPLVTLDFWNWGKPALLVGGFPLWVIGSALAGLALSGLFALFFFTRQRAGRVE
jgi:SSS family solute:Na+ symporter